MFKSHIYRREKWRWLLSLAWRPYILLHYTIGAFEGLAEGLAGGVGGVVIDEVVLDPRRTVFHLVSPTDGNGKDL